MREATRFVRQHWKKCLLAGLILLTLICFDALADGFFTLRLMLNLADAAGQQLEAEHQFQRELSVVHQDREYRALVYVPKNNITPIGVLFLPGLTAQGVRHPRFLAVAQGLAKTGYVVLTADIVSLRQFKLERKAIEEIIFWHRYMREELDPRLQHVGIAGVSVSGTLALIATARPTIRERVGFVVSIGGYQNLLRCSRRWFSSHASEQGQGNYSSRHYGRWISMLSALGCLENRHDRECLAEVLHQLLVTGKRPRSPEHLTTSGRRWFQAAVSKEIADQQLVDTIEAWLASRLTFLSPEEELRQIRCPVFLVHGLNDQLIPSSETLELKRRLTSAENYVLVTPLISHTYPQFDQLKTGKKWRAYLEGANFLYTLVRVSSGHSRIFPWTETSG